DEQVSDRLVGALPDGVEMRVAGRGRGGRPGEQGRCKRREGRNGREDADQTFHRPTPFSPSIPGSRPATPPERDARSRLRCALYRRLQPACRRCVACPAFSAADIQAERPYAAIELVAARRRALKTQARGALRKGLSMTMRTGTTAGAMRGWLRPLALGLLALAAMAGGSGRLEAAAGQPVAIPSCRGIAATIVGTNGDDVVTGTPGPDVIQTYGGNDRINGAGGDDLICAGAGNDNVSGSWGMDIIYGEDGNDVLRGDDDDDTLYGGAGIDNLFGDGGMDHLFGDDDRDVMRGGDDDDAMWGSEGDDIMFDGEGTDHLLAGPGNDYAYGGPGE